MPRDYARNRRQSEERSGPSGFVWMLSGVLIGLIIAGGFYIKNQSKLKAIVLPQEQTASQPQSQAQTHAPATKPQASPQNLQTQFDFYNVLPSQKVIGPAGDEDTSAIQNQNNNLQNPQPSAQAATPTAPMTTAPVQAPQQQAAMPQAQPAAPVVQATPTPAAPTPSTKPSGYILQIASFSQYSDADQLKAQLSLLGFDVKISTIQKSGKTLQRVWLGPFTSRDEAQSAQKQLQENLISSKILKSSS